jgi:hypothetical protein
VPEDHHAHIVLTGLPGGDQSRRVHQINGRQATLGFGDG